MRALREEALDLRRDIVTAENAEGAPIFGEEARLESFKSLPDGDFDSIDRWRPKVRSRSRHSVRTPRASAWALRGRRSAIA
jgi:hypothetical protein